MGSMRRLRVRLLAEFLAESKLSITVSHFLNAGDRVVHKAIEPMIWKLASKQLSAKML